MPELSPVKHLFPETECLNGTYPLVNSSCNQTEEGKMAKAETTATGLRTALRSNRLAQAVEIATVLLAGSVIAGLAHWYAVEDPLVRQSIVWLANMLMLFLIWLGLKFRGQGWKNLGLEASGIRVKSILLSFVVFLAAILSFALGSILMANITGIPESADMSGYQYIQGNLPMLFLALLAIFIASSFGEEVIYRGFLISRISEIGGNGKASGWIAVACSSVIFGLIHFDWGAMGMVQTAFMGMALGSAYILLDRNLWILVFAHAYMDAILMVQIYLGMALP